jgi:hypothetical protein
MVTSCQHHLFEKHMYFRSPFCAGIGFALIDSYRPITPAPERYHPREERPIAALSREEEIIPSIPERKRTPWEHERFQPHETRRLSPSLKHYARHRLRNQGRTRC